MAEHYQPRDQKKAPFKDQFKSEWITKSFDRDADKFAEKFGCFLKEVQLSSSQIRNIYGEIKNLQMRISTDIDFEREKGRFILTKAKMAYTAGRNKSEGLENFRTYFDQAHKEVHNKETFDRFVNFITAVFAYHRAAGGK